MRQLHGEAFGDSSSTDCMSFPLAQGPEAQGPGDPFLGDVVVCPHVARQRDPSIYRELTLYLVHGLLHLMGYDDQRQEDRAVMERRQFAHLAWLESNKKLITP